MEHVAAKRIGRETVQYVSNIGKYWVAYRLASRHLERRDAAAASLHTRRGNRQLGWRLPVAPIDPAPSGAV